MKRSTFFAGVLAGIFAIAIVTALCIQQPVAHASHTLPPIAHASLSHNANLTVASTTAAYAIPFSTNDDLEGITHTAGDTNIIIINPGDYNISLSAIIDNTANTNNSIDVWLKVNSTNVVNSNTIVAVTDDIETPTAAVTFIYDFARGDTLRVMYRGSATTMQMTATGTQSNLTRPACPSIVATIYQVGR